MSQPTFQRAKAYSRGGFVSEISSTTAGESFDVGPGPDTGVIVRFISTSGAGGDDLTSVVFGGVTLTALAQQVIPDLTAKERFFYAVGQSFTGAQTWTATAAAANGQLQVQIYAASDVTAATFATRFDVLSETLSTAVATNSNSLTVGLISITNTGSPTNAPTAPTVERFDDATGSTFYTPYILERPGAGSSVNLQATSTGNTFTPGWAGRAVSLEGSAASAPTLSSPSGTATGNTTGSGTVSTTGSDGLMWRKAAVGASTDPGAGNEAGAGWVSTAVTASGAQAAAAFTGLTTGVAVDPSFLHVTAGGLRSSVATGAPFTPSTMTWTGTYPAQSGTSGSAFAHSGSIPTPSGGIGAKTYSASGLGASGLTMNTSNGQLQGTCGTAGTYNITPTVTDSSTAGTNPSGGGSPPQTVALAAFVLTIGTGGAATAVTMSGPSSGLVGLASTNFTIGANGVIAGTVTVTPNDSGAGGSFAPTSVNISSASPTATFTYTPVSTGAKLVSVTNNGGLANPTPITYTANASGSFSLAIGPGFLMAGGTKIINASGQWCAWQAGDVGSFGAPINGASTSDSNGIWTISGLPLAGTTRVLIKNTSGEFVGYWVGTAA